MHIMLFVLIMIITVSVIFIPIIHKSTVDDIAAIEAMDSNGDTVEPGLNVAPGLKTETLIAVYVVLALCPSIFLMGLYPRFRQPVSVETNLMSRYCPIVDHNVTYQFCEDCEDRQCSKRNNKNKLKENKSNDTCRH